jgi:hypothetical protein
MNTLMQSNDADFLIAYLQEEIQKESACLELGELVIENEQLVERKEKLKRMQSILNCLMQKKCQALMDFMKWDCAHTVEILNFLMNEFFANGFAERNWDKAFVSDVVFETTRTINLITKLSTSDPQDPSLS